MNTSSQNNLDAKRGAMARRTEFIACLKRTQAIKACPWACVVKKMEGGYIAYESQDDYKSQFGKYPTKRELVKIESSPNMGRKNRRNIWESRSYLNRVEFRAMSNGVVVDIEFRRAGETKWHHEGRGTLERWENDYRYESARDCPRYAINWLESI